jgi:hypothetical protein
MDLTVFFVLKTQPLRHLDTILIYPDTTNILWSEFFICNAKIRFSFVLYKNVLSAYIYIYLYGISSHISEGCSTKWYQIILKNAPNTEPFLRGSQLC